MIKRRANLTGQKFTRLRVLNFKEVKDGYAYWNCICDCGSAVVATTARLVSDNTRSCGCLQKEVARRTCLSRRKKITACSHVNNPHYGKGLCRACWLKQNPRSIAYRKQWRANLKNKLGKQWYSLYLRERNLLRNYKLNFADVEQLKTSQNNACPCGASFSHQTPHIDHNHNCCPKPPLCGKCIRGLLCSRCNLVLGLLNEDPKLLPTYLMDYLQRCRP